MALDSTVADLLQRKGDPAKVLEALNNAYLPKEKLLTADDLGNLAEELRRSKANPEVIGAFVVSTAQEHRIVHGLQGNIPGGRRVPPHLYVAGAIADELYGVDLEMRMKYASFHLQGSFGGREQNSYEMMRDCLGRYSEGPLGFQREWDVRKVLSMARSLSLVHDPTEGHKLVHAFPDLSGIHQNGQETTCFEILKPTFPLEDLFASYIHEAFYDYDQTNGAWGIYDELKQAVPLFAKAGLTPKDAALGIMQSDFHARFMIGVMKDLGFNLRQIRRGVAQACAEYVDSKDNTNSAFSILKD